MIERYDDLQDIFSPLWREGDRFGSRSIGIEAAAGGNVAVPYAGMTRIRFEGVISGRNGHP